MDQKVRGPSSTLIVFLLIFVPLVIFFPFALAPLVLLDFLVFFLLLTLLFLLLSVLLPVGIDELSQVVLISLDLLLLIFLRKYVLAFLVLVVRTESFKLLLILKIVTGFIALIGDFLRQASRI